MSSAIAKLRPSARKLHKMLPKTFMLRVEHVGGEVVHAEVLTREGAPTELDAGYPGFGTGLDALTKAGLVILWGRSPVGTKLAGRVDCLYSTIRPEPATEVKKEVDE